MRILVDMDNTICDSVKAIVDCINEEYKKNFKVNYRCTWDFDGCLPKWYLPRALELFNEQIFYDNLEPIKDSVEVLERLSRKHEIVIVTKHGSDGVTYKAKWIRNNFPFINRVIYLDQSGFDKSIINGDIIIDDRVDCLLGGNRDFRLLFGNYGWNQEVPQFHDEAISRANTWLDIEDFIIIINNYKNKIIRQIYKRK